MFFEEGFDGVFFEGLALLELGVVMFFYGGLPVVHVLDKIFSSFLFVDFEEVGVAEVLAYHSGYCNIERWRVLLVFLVLLILI